MFSREDLSGLCLQAVLINSSLPLSSLASRSSREASVVSAFAASERGQQRHSFFCSWARRFILPGEFCYPDINPYHLSQLWNPAEQGRHERESSFCCLCALVAVRVERHGYQCREYRLLNDAVRCINGSHRAMSAYQPEPERQHSDSEANSLFFFFFYIITVRFISCLMRRFV